MRTSIKIAAQIEGVQTRKDKTVKVVIGTQELTPQTAAELFRLQNALVYVVMKEEDFGQEEVEAIEALEAEFVDDRKKRPSRRLRDVLYRLWEQDSKGFEDSNLHYLHMMEKIIGHYKSKLP